MNKILTAAIGCLLSACAYADDPAWGERMAKMRSTYLSKFCDTRTNLLYAPPGTDADRDKQLPDPKLVREQKPDYRGYGTGMSDTALFGGKVLGALCEAYDATGDERIATDARRLFKGLTFMMTVTKEKGFVPRGPHPADIHAYYKDSSGDQHWMWMYAMYRTFHSKLATPEDKRLIGRLMADVVRRFERNGWVNLNEGNTKPAWASGGHLKTPKFAINYLSLLAIAHATTGDEKWGAMYRDACEEKDGERLRLLREKDLAPMNIYHPEQTSNKLYVLAHYDKDPKRRALFNTLRKKQAELCLAAKYPDLLAKGHRPKHIDDAVKACGDKAVLNGAFDWRGKMDEDLMYRRGKWAKQSALFGLHHIRTVVRWPLIAFNVALRSGDPDLAARAAAEARAIIEKTDWDYRLVKWDNQTRAIVAGSLIQAQEARR